MIVDLSLVDQFQVRTGRCRDQTPQLGEPLLEITLHRRQIEQGVAYPLPVREFWLEAPDGARDLRETASAHPQLAVERDRRKAGGEPRGGVDDETAACDQPAPVPISADTVELLTDQILLQVRARFVLVRERQSRL